MDRQRNHRVRLLTVSKRLRLGETQSPNRRPEVNHKRLASGEGHSQLEGTRQRRPGGKERETSSSAVGSQYSSLQTADKDGREKLQPRADPYIERQRPKAKQEDRDPQAPKTENQLSVVALRAKRVEILRPKRADCDRAKQRSREASR
jgi:hypothetical protein